MPVIHVNSLDDPRLEPYRDLKDRELARRGGLFIAEGEHVVRRLLASAHEVHSLLLAQRRAEEIAPLARGDYPVYVIGDEQISRVLGFKFHSGVIACGRRPPGTGATLDRLCAGKNRLTLLVCPQVINHENLGSLLRIAAAFGVDGFVLGPESCDPYWRRSVRVSMGAVFSLRIARSADLASDLCSLREHYGVELIASVLDHDALPLSQAPRPRKLALLLGNEAQGLDRALVNLCDRGVTIPMRLGTDSLNVSVAAAVMLYHFTKESATDEHR